MDSLPPPPPSLDRPAASDLSPRSAREAELCAQASHPDWVYLGGLLALDVGAVLVGSSSAVKYSGSGPSLASPAMIGVTWGATLGGAWLALPKCAPHWVEQTPLEGDVRETWPLAFSLALLAGATAPIVYGIAIGSSNLPAEWSDFDRALHVVVGAAAGFGGALLPYLFPPRTWRAAQEMRRIRLGANTGGAFLSYGASF